MENNFSNELRNRIKNLNVEIKNHFNSKKTCSVRRKIIPGNSKSLWDAVKLAKDVNNPKIPNHMLSNNIEIPKKDLPEAFAEMFIRKVKSIVDEQVISETVYNGKRKINCTETNFMTEQNILKAVKSMKIKNCVNGAYDNYDIPTHVLLGADEKNPDKVKKVELTEIS